MNASVLRRPGIGLLGMLAIGVALLTCGPTLGHGNDIGAKEKPVATVSLPNVPGKSISAVLVTYSPGGKSPRHHHGGSVFAYILSGDIRSENSATGPGRVYHVGESFFEPPGSEHLVSENASASEPASMLAIFIADDGAQLTTVDK